MKKNEKPEKIEESDQNETGESREKLLQKVEDLTAKVEALEEEKDQMTERLVEFEETLVKLSGELEIKNTPKPPPLSPEAKFRKDYPKEKYMVKHAINHGEMIEGENVKLSLEVGQPFPNKDKSLRDKFLKSGQVIQIA